MEPWEIMISESQERMVAVVRPEQLAEVEEVCDRWELAHARSARSRRPVSCAPTSTAMLVGAIPAAYLTDEAPRYDVSSQPRAPGRARSPLRTGRRRRTRCSSSSPRRTSAAAPGSTSRYDHLVGSRTVRRPGLDAAVLRLRPSLRGLAVSLDGSGRIARLDPRTGGALAVLEAARNVACAGGEPLAITDCLNFGNPEKPEIAWELAEAIEGMARRVRGARDPRRLRQRLALQRDRRPRDPPHAGRRLRRARRRRPHRAGRGGTKATRSFSPAQPELSFDGSEYQALYGELGGRPARLDLGAEAALIDVPLAVAPRCSLVHDVSEGGLAVALAEAALVERRRRRARPARRRRSRSSARAAARRSIACAPTASAARRRSAARSAPSAGVRSSVFTSTHLRQAWERSDR